MKLIHKKKINECVFLKMTNNKFKQYEFEIGTAIVFCKEVWEKRSYVCFPYTRPRKIWMGYYAGMGLMAIT